MRSIPFLFLRLNSWTKVVDETVVKFFSTKMGIIGSGLYFENTLLNSKERYIERSSIKIEDENVEDSWRLGSLQRVKLAHVEQLSHTSSRRRRTFLKAVERRRTARGFKERSL
jgi:hypothetical protein